MSVEMKINKKLLTIICSFLAIAGIVVSAAVPAVAEETQSSSSVTDIIRVIVYDKYPAVNIVSPLNESITTNPLIQFGVDYENINHIDFILHYTDADGELHDDVVDTFTPDPSTVDPDLGIFVGAGTATSREIDLRDYNGYGTYVLTARIKGVNEYDEDEIEFSFYPFNMEKVGTDENGDPIVKVSYSPEVANFELQVYNDSDGKRAILDEPIAYEVDTEDTTGSREFILPFASYGLATGTYYIVATGVNIDEEDLGPIMRPLDYVAPAAPDVPKTGFFSGKLNIAKEDYLITSIIAFIIAIVCATIVLIHQKEQKRRSSRRRH